MDKHCPLININIKSIILILGLQINLKMPSKKIIYFFHFIKNTNVKLRDINK